VTVESIGSSDASGLHAGVARSPRETIFGPGSAELIPGLVAKLGCRPFVIADRFLATDPLLGNIVAELRERACIVSVFTEVVPELPRDCVDAAVAAAQAHEPDVVIGFGGGSSLDLAKVVSLLSVTGGAIVDFYGENKIPESLLPVVAVPTTAGTGSEVTPVAVVSDPDRELKVGISSPQLVPFAAIVDPLLTVSCPAEVSAHSGIDALCHAVESLTARARGLPRNYPLPVFVGANAFSIDASLRAAALIMGNLEAAVKDGGNLEARQAMSLGSLTAGVAFASGGTHLAHAIQYPVGAVTKTPHGLGVGLLLPYVLEACAPNLGDSMHRLAKAIQPADETSGGDPLESVLGRIVDLRKQIGIPHTLAEIGLAKAELTRVIELSQSVERLVNNAPGDDPAGLVPEIVRRAWSGRSEIFPSYANG